MKEIRLYESGLVPADAQILFVFSNDCNASGITKNIIGFTLPHIYGAPHIYVMLVKIHKDKDSKASVICITDEYCHTYKNYNIPSFDSAKIIEHRNNNLGLLVRLTEKNGSKVNCIVNWSNIKPVVHFLSNNQQTQRKCN